MNVVQERIARKMCTEHGGPNHLCEMSARMAGYAATAVQEWLLEGGHTALAAECGPLPAAGGNSGRAAS